jgi:hypothetical protein
MNRPLSSHLALGLAGATLAAFAGRAAAAPEVSETAVQARPIDARVVRVRVEGIVDLRIRQGAQPQLLLSGEKRQIERTTTVQEGDELAIGTEGRGRIRLGGVHAELTLPALREVVSESLGATTVQGFSGEELNLTLDGAGAMQVSAHYRLVSASLGGVGSMRLEGLVADGVKLDLGGAGFVNLSGRARWLKADLGGLGNLDAREFQAEDVDLDLSGLGNASVQARQNANLTLSGMGSVTVFGKPLNRKVAVDGLGKVSWK